MRAVLIIAVLAVLAVPARAQDDSTEYKVPKRVGLALVETIGINGLIWSFDRYLREDNYSFYISWRSIENNLRHGMEWDPNKFKGNFLDHPYHGSTYFNAARTNGLSFWESLPFSFAGSLMWETTMESEYPAYNDLLATTLGGASLGETLFRFSEQVLDDRTRGGSRIWREAVALLLNPVGGFNRLIRGDLWRRSSTVNHIRKPLTGMLAIGGRARIIGDVSKIGNYSHALELTLHYGDPFASDDTRLPFEYFTFRYWSSSADTTRSSTVLASANLVGRNFKGNGEQSNLAGIFQHFDYINTELFKIGSISACGGLLSKFNLGKKFHLITGPQFGYIIIGAGNNEYVYSYQGRDYNFGWGMKGKLDVLLSHETYGSLYLDYNYFGIYAREGAPGVDHLQLLDASYTVPVWKGFGLGAEYTYYRRNARYDEFPDVKKTINSTRFLVVYTI